MYSAVLFTGIPSGIVMLTSFCSHDKKSISIDAKAITLIIWGFTFLRYINIRTKKLLELNVLIRQYASLDVLLF